MKAEYTIAIIIASAGMASGQVTITSKDMFSTVGQYYRVYANPAPTALSASHYDVTGRLGNPGGPQVWDFSTGPTNVIYRYDYVETSDGSHGDNYPLAKYAERQTVESTGVAKAWMYLEQVAGVGRRNYGFVNPADDPSEGQFNPPIIDFPDPLKYQDTWNLSTTFDFTVLGLMPARINYSAEVTVDAYGTIILPGLGTNACLRVNELDTYETLVDLEMTGDFQSFETDYIRIYYFLCPGSGIVAEVHSQQSSAGAPDINFTDASQFSRMFELSRGGAVPKPEPITDLTLTPMGGGILLNWSKTANTVSYRIDCTSNPSDPASWQALGSTTKAFFLDTATSGATLRFYRVISLAQ